MCVCKCGVPLVSSTVGGANYALRCAGSCDAGVVAVL